MGRALLPPALLFAAMAASPAAAIDAITGVWEGKFTCDATAGATTSHSKAVATFFFDDRGSGKGVLRISNVTLESIPIRVVSGADALDRARVAGTACSFDPATGGIVVEASLRIRPGSEKGTMTGEVIE